MKLNFLFIVMDLFTILAYPIVFVHAKLHQFAKQKQGVRLTNFFVILPVPPAEEMI